MEVDEPVLCFNCMGTIECGCLTLDSSWNAKCCLCSRPIRIFEKVMKVFDPLQLYTLCQGCCPAEVRYVYDYEDMVWRFTFRRMHY
jgi:hypothetical protein